MTRVNPALPSASSNPAEAAKALALALERLRRAGQGVIDATYAGQNVDHALNELDAALSSSIVSNGNYMAWAQDVLDGLVVPAKRKGRAPQTETFDALRKRAVRAGLYIHFVQTMEGTEYAIYRNHSKIGHATNETTCAQKLKRFMAAKR